MDKVSRCSQVHEAKMLNNLTLHKWRKADHRRLLLPQMSFPELSLSSPHVCFFPLPHQQKIFFCPATLWQGDFVTSCLWKKIADKWPAFIITFICSLLSPHHIYFLLSAQEPETELIDYNLSKVFCIFIPLFCRTKSELILPYKSLYPASCRQGKQTEAF